MLLTAVWSVPHAAWSQQPWNAGGNIAPVMTNAPSALFPNAQVVNSTNPLPKEQGGSGDSSGAIPGGAHVVTSDDESSTVPNARQLTAGTNTTIDTSTPGQIKVNASGGGGGSASPFAPAGFANVTTFTAWYDLAVSPDGAYVYVAGALGSGNAAIAQVKIADGTVTATRDFGSVLAPYGLAVSPDSAHIYAINQYNSADFWDLSSSGLSINHHSTLTHAPPTKNFPQDFDLSPDGTIYAYVDRFADKVYEIDTGTYVQSSVTVGHSDGGGTAGSSAVCWYNGSSANFYVAYNGNASVDLYSAGVYTSTVATGAGGTPAFNAMRSGINGNFFIADSGTNKSVISVTSGTPQINLSRAPKSLVVDTLSPIATCDGVDRCFFQANGNTTDFFFELDTLENSSYQISPISTPDGILQDGAAGIAVSPDSAANIFSLSGCNYPEVWSIASLKTAPPTKAAGNIQTSDGLGSWTSAAPFSTSGWTGSASVGGGGTVTETCPPCNRHIS